jgi:hypothetical protein
VKRARSSWKATLLLAALWINFVALWYRVYHITSVGDVRDSFNYLGGLISAYGLLVTWWILHNIRIYRKKGNRSVRQVQHLNTHDSLQRFISRRADLHRGQEILVDVLGDRKVFVEGPGVYEKQPAATQGVR